MSTPPADDDRKSDDLVPSAAVVDAALLPIVATPRVAGQKRVGSRAGRRPSAVWEFFAEVRTESNKVHAKCRFCGRQCAGVAARMVRHILTKCPSAPEDAALVLGDAMSQSTAGAVSHAKKRRVTDDSGVQDGVTSYQSGGFSVLEATKVHRQLVLACVLNDVAVQFVEDEALMRAFAVARPGLPRLKAEAAQTTVLKEVKNEVKTRIGRALAQTATLTLVYRHFRRRDSDQDKVIVHEWVGLDQHRYSMLLHEVERPTVLLNGPSTAEDKSCCLPYAEIDAVIQAQCGGTATGTIINLCCDCPAMMDTVRQTKPQNEHLPSPSGSTEPSTSTQATEDETSSPHPVLSKVSNRSVVLLGTCMLRHSMILRKKLLSMFPSLVDVLGQATLLAHSLVANSHVNTQIRRSLREILVSDASSYPSNSCSWDFHARLVKRVLSLEPDIRVVTIASAVSQDEFWTRLREADSVMTPFSWMFALSEVRVATTGQFVVLWLWLLSVLEGVSLHDVKTVEASKKAQFVEFTLDMIKSACSDHHQLVSVMLDPRIHGTGLSATGRRHGKSLVVEVAARLFPTEGFDIPERASRTKLLDQLSHFLEKTGPFADEVAWEMSAGKDPVLFWNDYSVDAPELARVAISVFTFPAVVQTAAEFIASSLTVADSAKQRSAYGGWKQTFGVRQLKHEAAKNGQRGSVGMERLMSNHRELLFPSVPSMPAGMDPNATSADDDEASLTIITTGTTVETFVSEQIHQLILLDDEYLGRRSPPSNEESGNNGKDLTDAEPTTADTANSDSATSSSATSWFAYRSSSERAELEKAIKRFLPALPSALL